MSISASKYSFDDYDDDLVVESRSCRKRYAGNNCNPAFLWRNFFVTEELGILVVGWGFTQHNAMGDGSDGRQNPKGPRWSGVKRGISTQHSGRELFWTQVPLLQCKDIWSEINTWFKTWTRKLSCLPCSYFLAVHPHHKACECTANSFSEEKELIKVENKPWRKDEKSGAFSISSPRTFFFFLVAICSFCRRPRRLWQFWNSKNNKKQVYSFDVSKHLNVNLDGS